MFRKLLTFDEAQQIVRNHYPSRPLGVEEVTLLETHHRILAEDVISTLNIPPFDRSTVDGYAVRAGDTFGAEENKPIKLRVCGVVNVGEMPRVQVRDGMAAEIVTGAPIPEGSDAVVMLEEIEREANNLYVYNAMVKDENVMKAGADVKKDEIILKKGQLLTSREIGVLAAMGFAKSRVCLVPRIAVLSTGAEVTEPGRKLPPGKIYDINSYSLSAAVLESGGTPVYLGMFPDDLAQLQEALRKALSSADMVITSGGVSVGPKDVVSKALNSLGKPGVIVCGITIKPGKPTTVASLNRKLIFSLPGHPTSALLVFHLFARPVIKSLGGRKTRKPFEVKATATMRMFPAKGRRTFVMVKLKHDKANKLKADPVENGLSGAITTLAKADGFVEIAENQQFVDVGDEVTVKLFKDYAS